MMGFKGLNDIYSKAMTGGVSEQWWDLKDNCCAGPAQRIFALANNDGI